jgi:hypothetical protein
MFAMLTPLLLLLARSRVFSCCAVQYAGQQRAANTLAWRRGVRRRRLDRSIALPPQACPKASWCVIPLRSPALRRCLLGDGGRPGVSSDDRLTITRSVRLCPKRFERSASRASLCASKAEGGHPLWHPSSILPLSLLFPPSARGGSARGRRPAMIEDYEIRGLPDPSRPSLPSST